MKKFGLALFALLAATAAATSNPSPAAAGRTIWYCELTGAGYDMLDRDSYSYCVEQCVVNGQQGECWTSPPPPPGPGPTPPSPCPCGPENQD